MHISFVTVIIKAANDIEPKADLKIHFQAILKDFD